MTLRERLSVPEEPHPMPLPAAEPANRLPTGVDALRARS